MPHLPSGMIVIWSGAVVDIPADFVLCDGNNGTPDLRDRFVLGAGSSYDPDDTGGEPFHTHVFTGDGHTHGMPGGMGIGSGSVYDSTLTGTQVTGTTDNGASFPPFFALAYMMKI